MLSKPTIIERPTQPYLAICEKVTMPFNAVVDRVFPEFFGWMGQHGIPFSDAPFIKYNCIDMARELELEFGAPVTEPMQGDSRVVAGTIPAGRYGLITWQGGYDKLVAANGALIDWAREQGIRWDMEATPEGDRFAGRLEIYRTDPAAEPDPSKWVTDILIKITD
ncbi:transcription activator, effector binding [Devosia sp. DBB001]|nr:transcription activator, effector binding [Devosia sp. DBB001]